IMAKLQELKADVSRSALGRHVKGLAEVGERLRRSRMLAEALTAKFGDQPDDQVGRLNFELMNNMVFEVLTAAAGAEDEEGQPV
ncbi:phage protein Gp27 family protein, partial [Staphylococcus gallinarum]|uniref:phage protein Gp27 family protein n=1 Tax=Staphylococcus gallinarum TaxID=1293 RepID=UPI00317E34FE